MTRTFLVAVLCVGIFGCTDPASVRHTRPGNVAVDVPPGTGGNTGTIVSPGSGSSGPINGASEPGNIGYPPGSLVR